MRASRLLSILMILQARARVTAQELADECDVSLRTIYRDVDALSAAGVPVYSDRGSSGGYRLLDGYRTRLNGLSEREVEALFLSGLSGPAAALGLGAVMAGAQVKLTAALPAEMRSAAEKMRRRFHLDAPAWFQDADQPQWLQDVATAVWNQQLIEIRYTSWKAEKWRRVAPLGIVLKAGAWYLVGSVDGSLRTYRVTRMREVSVQLETFERPAQFDLASYWSENTQRLETELHPTEATLRVSPIGFKIVEALTSPFARSRMEIGEADEDGYRTLVMPVGPVGHACSDILRFGAEAEVLGPPELRARMTDITAKLRATYATAGD